MTPEQKQRIEQIEQWQESRRGLVDSARKHTDLDASHPEIRMHGYIDFLLSLVKSQEAGGDLQSRDDVLKFFGASLKENGDLSIDMKKYHAAHLCQEHSFEPWRRNEIEDKCVMCLARDRENAAASMRSACVEKVRAVRSSSLWNAEGYGTALSNLITELESLSIEKPKE